MADTIEIDRRAQKELYRRRGKTVLLPVEIFHFHRRLVIGNRINLSMCHGRHIDGATRITEPLPEL